MEEKKKIVRPTWAMVRALEAQVTDLQAKLDDQIDGTSMLVQDCDGWRDKYRALLAEKNALADEVSKLRGGDDASLYRRIVELEGLVMDWKERAESATAELNGLRGRSFLRRLFNK